MNERDRVLQVMQSEGMNAKRFCQEVGISQGTLSNILGGRNKPSLDILQAILRRFRAVSCDWLVMGVGTMYINGAREEGVLNLFDTSKEDVLSASPDDSSRSVDACIVPHASSITRVDAPANTSAISSTQRTVSKILVFYSDGTFEER